MNQLDLHHSMRGYLDKIIKTHRGLKALILDEYTTKVVSVVCSHSEVLQQEVYLVDRIEADERESMPHLHGVIFVRPTRANVRKICEELKQPCFGQYYIYFTNKLAEDAIQRIAKADEFELVQTLQEVYGDFIAITDKCFSFGMDSFPALAKSDPGVETAILDQIDSQSPTVKDVVDRLFAVLLALKKNPAIRFSNTSPSAQAVARQLSSRIGENHSLFDFRKVEHDPILIILDRRDDAISPILQNWSYQAMVHDALRIHDNRVSLRDVPNAPADMQDVVMSSSQDEFFRDSMHTDYGTLMEKVKTTVNTIKEQEAAARAMTSSTAEIQKAVENIPELRRAKMNVGKHVAITSELARRVKEDYLFEVSELQQDIVMGLDEEQAFKSILEIMRNPSVKNRERLSLIALFSAVYDTKPGLPPPGKGGPPRSKIAELLRQGEASMSPSNIDELRAFQEVVNRSYRCVLDPLAGNKSDIFGRSGTGSDNAYMRHTPLLAHILQQHLKGKLSVQDFPHATISPPMGEKSREIIVFVLGGVTYAETAAAQAFMDANKPVSVVLGGTTIANSGMFMSDLRHWK